MPEMRFHVTIGPDGVIRPPEGVALPEGEAEVTVSIAPVPAPLESDPMASTRAWLLGMAEIAEAIAPPMPADLAENHDHYAHGKARP